MHPQGEIEVIFLAIVIFVFTILNAFIISLLFLFQKRHQKFQRRLETIRSSHEKETFKAQLEMQEETFQYISREIHDNVGQFLSLAKLQLNTLDFDDTELALGKVQNSTELLTRALDDLRDLSRNLNSEMIQQGGLCKAVEQQISQLQKTGRYNVIHEIKGEYQYLPEQKEIILFRILQEAINNIMHHSAAKAIIILLSSDSGTMTMRIQDDGKGFDPLLLDKSKRRLLGGINNMKKRAEMIDANFEIDTSPGNGTKITVSTNIKVNPYE